MGHMRHRTPQAALAAALCALFGGFVLLTAAIGDSSDASAPSTQPDLCGALPVGSQLPDGSTLSTEQSANASVIVGVAIAAGVGETGAVDAVTAAFTESRLTNEPSGDADSLGLFQERPSQGWGTPAQVLDPVYATEQFFSHLTAVPGWQSLDPATAAQDVERSAYPDRYQLWVGPATELVAGLSGTGSCTNAIGGVAASAGASTLPAGFSLPAGTPSAVVTAINYAVAQLGKPYVYGGTGPDGYDCSGLVMEAYLAAGISLPRTTYDQVYAGEPVYDASELAPGDLLFTEGSDPGPGGAPGHVAMYVGDGLVIDAPETGKDIEITPLSTWITQIVAMRRIVS